MIDFFIRILDSVENKRSGAARQAAAGTARRSKITLMEKENNTLALATVDFWGSFDHSIPVNDAEPDQGVASRATTCSGNSTYGESAVFWGSFQSRCAPGF